MPRFERCLTALGMLIFLLPGTDGHAKQLLEVDGIVLSGTARLVTPKAGTCRVLRGGYWGDGPGFLRSAYRNSVGGDYRGSVGLGFRIARSLP